MRQFYRFTLVLISIVVATALHHGQSTTVAQDTPTRQYESLDGSFTFSYPESWVVNDTISNIDMANHVTVLDQVATEFVPGDVRLQIVPPQFIPVLLRAATEIDAQLAMDVFVESFNAPLGDDGIRLIEAARPIYRVDSEFDGFDVMILTVDVGDGGTGFIVAYAGSGEMASVEADVYELAASMQFVRPTLAVETLAPITADNSDEVYLLALWGGHTDWVGSLDINTEGTQIASIDGLSAIHVWDIATGRQSAVGVSDYPISAGPTFSADGQVVLGGSEGLIWVWDPATLATARDVNTIRVPIWAMQFSPDGTRLAVGGDDSVVHFFDYVSGDELAVLLGHTDAITDIVYSPDGSLLISASWDETIRVWNVETGEQVLEVAAAAGGVVTLDISPDGQRLVGGGYDSNVYIYDIATGELLFSLPEHVSGQPVVSVDFAPDGRLLASGAQDSTIIVWDTETGLPLLAAVGPGWMNDVQFSPDGKLLFAANDAGVIMAWGVRE